MNAADERSKYFPRMGAVVYFALVLVLSKVKSGRRHVLSVSGLRRQDNYCFWRGDLLFELFQLYEFPYELLNGTVPDLNQQRPSN